MLTALRERLRQQDGISLVEVAIVTVLLGVIMPPAFMFVLSTQRSERQVSEATQQQQDTRVAMESLTRHLREAGYPQGYTYSQSSIFLSAGQNDVVFYTDMDGDGVNERATYAPSPSESAIDRTVVEPNCSSSPCVYSGAGTSSSTSRVMVNVRNADLTACGEAPGSSEPVFRFYQLDAGTGALTEIPTPTADVSDLVDINYVSITLVTDITPGQSPTCQRLETAVGLRNWRG